jgi:hypothetical protein
MEYVVNDQRYIISEGEGIFCNSNALHAGYMIDDQDCNYISVTFHPKFIYGYENSLGVHIRHLREKLEAEPGAPQFLRTVRGIGYKLTKGEEA